ncbi:URC4/urg3 family protein [Uliginosibacterium sediminicola]|uniref:URC4/urg3 family protein n=1 Tax=Uliginosibacterium sediminicola TaxID=2024550 RepID=A0ABU9YXG5_9RHOO
MTLNQSGWHTPVAADHPAAALLSAAAVRERCAVVMRYVESGASPNFVWHADKLPVVARYVAETIRLRYPDLQVPYHSRQRHFEAGGVDRWQALATAHGLDADKAERARIAIDLVIPSVLLDAGAGAAWKFADAATGQTHARSEGLGVASLRMFESGALSADAVQPLRCDASALQAITPQRLAEAFQVTADNPLVGLEGRATLLRRLGEVIAATPAVFGTPARLGNLYDYLLSKSHDGVLKAAVVLETLLHALGPVWPGRIALDGVSLGDCWRHPALADGLLPFHKLTQWLTYSLLEQLEWSGLQIEGIDALTGLPEYRNGGLLLDLGLLEPRAADFATRSWQVDDEAIVEWRALTVIALDRIAAAVRTELGLSAAQFPLARVLEGGTWAAGRRIAAELRPGGGPPLTLISDGTVF